MNFYTIFLVLVIFFFIISFQKVYAEEPLPITRSFDMENVIFDGKWTTGLEWKRTSLETIYFDENFIAKLRFGHQDEFVYIMLDVVSDKNLDMDLDSTMICFDTDNSKSQVFDETDFCFSTPLGENPKTFQGVSSSNEIVQISNPTGFLAIGGVSDEINIYRKEPHPVFEFRIPTETIGRHDVYGFFISYYDSNSNMTYTWPSLQLEENVTPPPNMWGEMISPDKSLPEFGFPLFLLMGAFLPIIILIKIKKYHIFEFER